jgi:acetylornithine deacetylase/succinyl-diaminopimelate desuccinylase family protein
MNETERGIIGAVDSRAEDLTSFFQRLVRCRSFTGQEAEAANLLIDGMRRRGFTDIEPLEASPGRLNVLGRIRGTGEGPTYTFNGHLDVLPLQDESSWKRDPFGGWLEDGKIYGRGTVDMKSGTFGSFFAGLIFSSLRIPIRGHVLFTAVCDELVCGKNGTLYLLDKGIIKRSHPGDFGVNCEPTNLEEINMATKGVFRADITVIGKGAFSARPHLGINAIDKAAKLVTAIMELNDRIGADPLLKHPLLEPPSVLVAMIKGGEASNLVPDRCKLTVTRRLHPSETYEKCLEDCRGIIRGLASKDPDFRAEVAPWEGFRPPVELPLDAPVVSAFQRAHKLVRGSALRITGSEGGTDASHVVARTGMPMPVYGPGDYRLLGTVDEHVLAKDFLDAIKIYALTIYYTLGI